MKKVIKLTERDLMNIVKRVIKEREVEEDRFDFEKMSDKFNTIEKKVTELNYLQLNMTQQQVKLADIEIRLRQLELEIVKIRASVDTTKK